jgi:hypothetical protein
MSGIYCFEVAEKSVWNVKQEKVLELAEVKKN